MVGDPFREGSGSLSGPKYKDAIDYLVGQGISCASYSALSGGFCTGRFTREQFEKDPESMDVKELEKLIAQVKKKMQQAAADLDFESAAELRDKMLSLRKQLEDIK